MSDYIKREDAIEAVADYFDKLEVSRRYAKSILNNMPSADVIPRDYYDKVIEALTEKNSRAIGEMLYEADKAYDKGFKDGANKHGEWVETYDHSRLTTICRYKCSVCGQEYLEDRVYHIYYDGENRIVDMKYKFCPNCGARMVDDE